MLPVNEVFETIQGEGHYCGTPAIFIRLQGCPVGCPWCDTKFTWEQHPGSEVTAGEMMLKDHSGQDTWSPLEVEHVLLLIERYRARHVVITGGEPAMHNLRPLTAALMTAKRSSQLETSGTYEIEVNPATWVTVSPKINMPGGRSVLDTALARADEIKMPIGKAADIFALQRLLERGKVGPQVPVYLQPLSLSRAATDICVKNAIANNWRVSLQVHALAGWR